MQVIHQAACHGHIELIKTLIDKFGISPREEAIVDYIFIYMHYIVYYRNNLNQYTMQHFPVS